MKSREMTHTIPETAQPALRVELFVGAGGNCSCSNIQEYMMNMIQSSLFLGLSLVKIPYMEFGFRSTQAK